jgi:hypothetical protein
MLMKLLAMPELNVNSLLLLLALTLDVPILQQLQRHA